MDPLLILLAVAVLATASVALLLPRSDAARHRAAERLAYRSGLALLTELEPAIQRRLRRSNLLSILTGVGVRVVTLMVALAARPGPLDVGTAWLLNGIVVAGGAIGNAIAALVDSREGLVPAGARIARVRRLEVADFVPRAERWAARIGVALLLVALDVAAGTSRIDPALAALLTVAAVMALMLAEAGSRRVVGLRQPAASQAVLAWDDAVRARSIRASTTAPIVVSLYGAVGLCWSVSTSRGAPLDAVLLLVGLLLVLGNALVTVLSEGVRRTRYVLHRLWPETAAAATS